METSSPIAINDSYPLAAYIVLPIITVYCGLFLNISNHYVLRPKIQLFLEKVSFSSSIAVQVFLDILSNLSFITYAISAYMLTNKFDYPFRVLQYFNLYWMTVCLAIVIYLKAPNQISVSNIIFCKNGVILCLCYVNILYHYISNSETIILPAIMAGLYLINLVLNSYEQKFIQTILQLLNLQQPAAYIPKPKMISHLPTVEVLAANYPISRKQLQEHMKNNQKNNIGKQNMTQNRNRKPQKTQIDTKRVVKQKLMEISMCIHLSLMKKQDQEISSVRQYFGFMNGTLTSDGSNGSKAKLGAKHRKTYFNNRNKDKLLVTKRSTKKIGRKQKMPEGQNENKVQLANEKVKIIDPEQTNGNLADKYFDQQQLQNREQIAVSNLQSQSILFYIFPVKIFESSRIISTVFSIFINLGFGILLNYTQVVMNTLKYGRFSQFLLAMLFLPILPTASAIQFTNTMSLSSILKFGICGIFALISNAISNSNDYMSIDWQITPLFQYNTIVQVLVLLVAFGTILTKKSYKLLILAFLLGVGGNGIICYFSIITSY